MKLKTKLLIGILTPITVAGIASGIIVGVYNSQNKSGSNQINDNLDLMSENDWTSNQPFKYNNIIFTDINEAMNYYLNNVASIKQKQYVGEVNYSNVDKNGLVNSTSNLFKEYNIDKLTNAYSKSNGELTSNYDAAKRSFVKWENTEPLYSDNKGRYFVSKDEAVNSMNKVDFIPFGYYEINVGNQQDEVVKINPFNHQDQIKLKQIAFESICKNLNNGFGTKILRKESNNLFKENDSNKNEFVVSDYDNINSSSNIFKTITQQFLTSIINKLIYVVNDIVNNYNLFTVDVRLMPYSFIDGKNSTTEGWYGTDTLLSSDYSKGGYYFLKNGAKTHQITSNKITYNNLKNIYKVFTIRSEFVENFNTSLQRLQGCGYWSSNSNHSCDVAGGAHCNDKLPFYETANCINSDLMNLFNLNSLSVSYKNALFHNTLLFDSDANETTFKILEKGTKSHHGYNNIHGASVEFDLNLHFDWNEFNRILLNKFNNLIINDYFKDELIRIINSKSNENANHILDFYDRNNILDLYKINNKNIIEFIRDKIQTQTKPSYKSDLFSYNQAYRNIYEKFSGMNDKENNTTYLKYFPYSKHTFGSNYDFWVDKTKIDLINTDWNASNLLINNTSSRYTEIYATSYDVEKLLDNVLLLNKKISNDNDIFKDGLNGWEKLFLKTFMNNFVPGLKDVFNLNDFEPTNLISSSSNQNSVFSDFITNATYEPTLVNIFNFNLNYVPSGNYFFSSHSNIKGKLELNNKVKLTDKYDYFITYNNVPLYKINESLLNDAFNINNNAINHNEILITLKDYVNKYFYKNEININANNIKEIEDTIIDDVLVNVSTRVGFESLQSSNNIIIEYTPSQNNIGEYGKFNVDEVLLNNQNKYQNDLIHLDQDGNIETKYFATVQNETTTGLFNTPKPTVELNFNDTNTPITIKNGIFSLVYYYNNFKKTYLEMLSQQNPKIKNIFKQQDLKRMINDQNKDNVPVLYNQKNQRYEPKEIVFAQQILTESTFNMSYSDPKNKSKIVLTNKQKQDLRNNLIKHNKPEEVYFVFVDGEPIICDSGIDLSGSSNDVSFSDPNNSAPPFVDDKMLAVSNALKSFYLKPLKNKVCYKEIDGFGNQQEYFLLNEVFNLYEIEIDNRIYLYKFYDDALNAIKTYIKQHSYKVVKVN